MGCMYSHHLASWAVPHVFVSKTRQTITAVRVKTETCVFIVCVLVISLVCVESCCAGAAEEDRNRRPADDPGQSEKGGGDQTLCGT